MFSDREILSVVEMLKNENLDVRTVTLGLNLLDCASDDIGRFTDNIYARITGAAKNLVKICDEVGDKYGIPVVNKRISVSPIAVAGAPFNAQQMLSVANTLNEAAGAARVDFIGGFSALVEKGIARGDRALIEAMPEALTSTQRVCASVNVASTRAGINIDAVLLMGRTIKEAARLTADRDGLACAKLCVFANIPQDIPFMAGAYLGVGEADAVINVGVSGPGVVKKAIDRATASNPNLNLGQISEIIKHTAYKVTRIGELIGREVAQRLGIKFGVVDLSLAPTPNVGDSVGHQRGKGIKVGIFMGGDDLRHESVVNRNDSTPGKHGGFYPLKGHPTAAANRVGSDIPAPAGAFRFRYGFRCSFWPAENEDRQSRHQCPPPPPQA